MVLHFLHYLSLERLDGAGQAEAAVVHVAPGATRDLGDFRRAQRPFDAAVELGLLGATVYGEILPVTAALLISFVATLLIGFGLKESRPVPLATDPENVNACKVFGQETKECFVRRSATLSNRDILSLPQIPLLLGINFTVMLGFSVFYIAFPTHAATTLEWQVTDTGAIEAAIDEIIAANPDKAGQVRDKPNMIGWFVGQVLKSTGGKANPQAVNQILRDKLGVD